jgi:hypothetical protein
VGFSGKLVGWLQSGDLFPGVETKFVECLPLQSNLRRADVVALLLHLGDVIEGVTGGKEALVFSSSTVDGLEMSVDRCTVSYAENVTTQERRGHVVRGCR